MKLHQLICGANSRRVRRASQTGGADVQFEERERGVEAAESAPGELVRKRQAPSVQEEQQQWTKRGLFKIGFNVCSPRVRSARKFTK